MKHVGYLVKTEAGDFYFGLDEKAHAERRADDFCNSSSIENVYVSSGAEPVDNQDGWISVSERLPEERAEPYQVIVVCAKEYDGMYQGKGLRRFQQDWVVRQWPQNFTHWMPAMEWPDAAALSRASSSQGVAPMTPENATERIDALLWQCIDSCGVFPRESKQIDPRTWAHLLVYAPEASSRAEVEDGPDFEDGPDSDGFKGPRPWNGFTSPPTEVGIESLRRTLAAIGIVGVIDGYDVIRRSSVLELVDRALYAAEAPNGEKRDA